VSTSRKIQIWKIYTYHGRRKDSFHVRWSVDGHRQKEVFDGVAAADAFRAELIIARGNSEPFDIATGLPQSLLAARQESEEQPTEVVRWYRFACEYLDSKWKTASPNYRRSIAEALVDAAEAFIEPTAPGKPSDAKIRKALWGWSFSGRLHGDSPSSATSTTVEWLQRNTIEITRLDQRADGSRVIRAALQRLAATKKGTPAADNTFRRKRMVLSNLLDYAVERDLLTVNPLVWVKWTRIRADREVDPAMVPNQEQVVRLLAAVEADGELGKRMKAFFACMYYAGLRPEEVTALRHRNLLSLPEKGAGRMRLTCAEPHAGTKWVDDRTVRSVQPLKARKRGKAREIPIHPYLAAILIDHRTEFPNQVNDRVLIGPRGGVPTHQSVKKLWQRARLEALTEAEVATDLAATPYQLRHACVSGWLAAGVPAAQVAAWAGHSVETLLRVYAKCVDGSEAESIRRILPPDVKN
jgi:integrase